ncbi:MAG: hypothetical protein ACM3JQ_05785, partial [Candidatus Eiseniibacteriota bacterium]
VKFPELFIICAPSFLLNLEHMYANKFHLSPRLAISGSLCFVVLLPWLLSACQLSSLIGLATPTATPAPTLEAYLMDRSILTDEPCPAPCWYGLELGKSGSDEIKNTLEKLSFINPDTIDEGPYYSYWDPTTGENLPAEAIEADCRSSQRRCVRLVMVNDALESVQLTPNYYLSIEEAVNHLGPPDYSRVAIGPDFEGCVSLFFSWDKKQIMMESIEKIGNSLCSSISKGGRIPPDLAINWITYGYPNMSFEREIGKPWPGFVEP